MSEPYLSVVIPAYNEAKRIGKTLGEMINYLTRQPFEWEIIVVDDGSVDETAAIAAQQLKSYPHVILRHLKNRGKGYAVKQGMLRAKGRYVLFSDADLSTPIEEVEGFLHLLQKGYDLVIASRALASSRIEIRQPFWREWMGRGFNRIARILSFKKIRDSQCGFKAFRREVSRDLFSAQKLTGFCFDAEIIYLAQKRGYRIFEAPVTWRNSHPTKVRLWDPIFMFADLVRIPWLHYRE